MNLFRNRMAHNLRLRYVIALVVMALCAFTSMAQREKNYIYLFDCTGSMIKNGLWDPAKSALDNNIALRSSIPNSHFTVIPFGDNPYQTFSFNNNEYSNKKQAITQSFEKNIKEAKYTNISEVLESGFSQTDSNKDNEIYLLTDGMPNGGDSPQKVAETITKWCANHRNSKLFYVALTKGVINPLIKAAVDGCPDASIVQCEDGIIPVITDISTDIYTNLDELDKVIEASFSVPGDYDLSITSTDELFDFNIVDSKASDGKIKIRITPKGNRSIDELHQILQRNEHEFQATITCADRRFVIANPIVNIHVLDEVPSRLTLADGVDELEAEDVDWHDSFLWSDAAPDEKAVWDLTPAFKNELRASKLALKFQADNGASDDFRASFNGDPIFNGSTITIVPNQPAIIEVQFNHDAATGKRYFTLTPTLINGLDFINERPSENYSGTSIRTHYSVNWNPIKTLFFWLGIALIACLIVWFIILKRIFFPTIKMGKVIITGPGSYYCSKKIKGARKIVMTSRRKSQNFFSRIFTGEIRHIIAEQFSPELCILPSGGKKKVKICSNGKSVRAWEITPSSIFGQDDTGKLTNTATGEKSEIEFC